MAKLPPDINIDLLVRRAGAARQNMQAVRALAKKLSGGKNPSAEDLGRAWTVCTLWRDRFMWALRGDIPDWRPFAGLRCLADFEVPVKNEHLADDVPEHFPLVASGYQRVPHDDKADPIFDRLTVDSVIDTPALCWEAAIRYFDNGLRFQSGKLKARGPVEAHFIKKARDAGFQATLGGQAGNMIWLWHCIGAQPRGYVPYHSGHVLAFSQIGGVPFLDFEQAAWQFRPLKDLAPGVPCNGCAVGAPGEASCVVVRGERRLIYSFDGLRDIEIGLPEPGDPDPFEWQRVRYEECGGRVLGEVLRLGRDVTGRWDVTWPRIPLFGFAAIEGDTLVVRLARPEDLKRAFSGIDYAVMGGIDAVFWDPWITREASGRLGPELVDLLRRQLRTLRDSGVRFGLELSNVPAKPFGRLLQELCQDGTIVAIGVNGIDELPDVVGEKARANELGDFYLPASDLPAETDKLTFEYLTYRRALKLAEATGVRTLFVHTTSLDFVLRRYADPGSLLHAQHGDMIGKGLVLAALLKRAYGATWAQELEGLPVAVKPDAMTALAGFVADMKPHLSAEETQTLVEQGYYLRARENYSLAVIPVLWPPEYFTETGAAPPTPDAAPRTKLPEKLNTTGAGDMTFAAFLFLGGV